MRLLCGYSIPKMVISSGTSGVSRNTRTDPSRTLADAIVGVSLLRLEQQEMGSIDDFVVFTICVFCLLAAGVWTAPPNGNTRRVRSETVPLDDHMSDDGIPNSMLALEPSGSGTVCDAQGGRTNREEPGNSATIDAGVVPGSPSTDGSFRDLEDFGNDQNLAGGVDDCHTRQVADLADIGQINTLLDVIQESTGDGLDETDREIGHASTMLRPGHLPSAPSASRSDVELAPIDTHPVVASHSLRPDNDNTPPSPVNSVRTRATPAFAARYQHAYMHPDEIERQILIHTTFQPKKIPLSRGRPGHFRSISTSGSPSVFASPASTGSDSHRRGGPAGRARPLSLMLDPRAGRDPIEYKSYVDGREGGGGGGAPAMVQASAETVVPKGTMADQDVVPTNIPSRD